MFYLVQKLGPAQTILFFWCLQSLYRRLTRKSQTPIIITGLDAAMITIVFSVIASTGAVLWGATNMSEYTWAVHNICVSMGIIGSCGFLFAIWRNKQRFLFRFDVKRKVDLITGVVIIWSGLVLFDLWLSSHLPIPNDYDPHRTVTGRILILAFGNPHSSIGFGSLMCLNFVFFISLGFAAILEEKSKNTNKAGNF
jgi:hypothetical protein